MSKRAKQRLYQVCVEMRSSETFWVRATSDVAAKAAADKLATGEWASIYDTSIMREIDDDGREVDQ
jgi:hypothetical protein